LGELVEPKSSLQRGLPFVSGGFPCKCYFLGSELVAILKQLDELVQTGFKILSIINPQ
jgi:hypothetical protein